MIEINARICWWVTFTSLILFFLQKIHISKYILTVTCLYQYCYFWNRDMRQRRVYFSWRSKLFLLSFPEMVRWFQWTADSAASSGLEARDSIRGVWVFEEIPMNVGDQASSDHHQHDHVCILFKYKFEYCQGVPKDEYSSHLFFALLDTHSQWPSDFISDPSRFPREVSLSMNFKKFTGCRSFPATKRGVPFPDCLWGMVQTVKSLSTRTRWKRSWDEGLNEISTPCHIFPWRIHVWYI